MLVNFLGRGGGLPDSKILRNFSVRMSEEEYSLGSCCHRLMEILTRKKVWKNLLAKTEMVKRSEGNVMETNKPLLQKLMGVLASLSTHRWLGHLTCRGAWPSRLVPRRC